MLTVGERIKYLRKQRGLTQAQLAEITGIHPVSIRKYETNKMQPQPPQIERIANALGINTGAFEDQDNAGHTLKTMGDLLSLLMHLHKSGILVLVGERLGEGGRLVNPKFVLNPVLKHYFSLTNKKEEVIPLDDLCVVMDHNEVYVKMTYWEQAYADYLQTSKAFLSSDDPQIQEQLLEKQEELELIEMSLQSDVSPLK